MGEWIRHRGSKTMPKRLEGVRFEVRFRDGSIHKGETIEFWDHQKQEDDVMTYRILEQIEPSTPDYTNGYPEGTTAADIGAKAGDKFVVISNESTAIRGTIVTLTSDDGSTNPFFHEESGKRRCISWYKLAPIQAKSAIELQAEEVGIPDPVNVEQIDTSPEHVEIDTETRHITPSSVNVLVDLGVESPATAPDFLQSALQTLTQRGKDYDKPEGERSAAAVAVAFNAITGRNLTESEVWLVLQLVKDVRQWQNPGRYHADSALDCVAYAALKAEALAKGGE